MRGILEPGVGRRLALPDLAQRSISTGVEAQEETERLFDDRAGRKRQTDRQSLLQLEAAVQGLCAASQYNAEAVL